MKGTENNVRSQHMDEEALRWATRLDGGSLSPAEQASLAGWLAADPAHEWRLAHFQQFYIQLRSTLPVMAAEGVLASSDDPPSTRRRSGARKWITVGVAAASIAIGALWLAQRPQSVTTHLAQRTSMRLADGSQVELNARSRIAVRIDGNKRHVRLEAGEAFFMVAKDAGHVFIVETPGGSVRVTGTQFNVRTSEDGALQVTVLEGSVAVRPDGGEKAATEVTLLRNDQMTVVAGNAELHRLSGEAAEDAAAWRLGKAVFNNTPLGEALQTFAGYHNLQVTITPEAAACRLGGRFTLDDFNQFLASLEDTLPVRVLRAESRVKILVR